MNSASYRALDWVSAETQPALLGLFTFIALGFFFAGLWPKLRVVLRAGPENRFDRPVQRIWNTVRIAILQTKLLKNRGAGWMHALIFWGFLVLLLRAGHFFVIGFFQELPIPLPGFELIHYVYSLIKDVFVLLVTLAVIFALYRRLVIRPPRLNLSGEGILILVLILAIMVSDVVFEGAYFTANPDAGTLWEPLGLAFSFCLSTLSPAGVAFLHNLAYWTHILSILFFLTLLPRSKHFHIITSIPNVYFSNVSGKGNQLSRIDFEDETKESFGVTRVEDFSWKALLDLHTCTECGRCDRFCPALKSGKPLSPKELTIDLRNHLNSTQVEVESQSSGVPVLLGGVIQDETLWSCTTCGACEEECPVMIEYVNRVIDLRRGLVLTEDRYPQELTRAFKSLETNSNPWGFGRDARADWAQDLGLKLWDKENPTEYLYFVGCNGSFDNRGKKIATAVAASLKAAGVDFSILGKEEGCTGDPARRAGNEYLFDMLATQNAGTFKENGVRKIISHCPHCFNSLKNEYPEFGVNLEVIHHSELLNQLIKDGKIAPSEKTDEKVVVHDSCYMGRHNQVYEAPRGVLAAKVQGESILEVEASRERGSCCGAGGGRFLLEETVGSKMSHNRIDELMQAEPDTIAVSCPYCVLMLEDGLKAKGLQENVKVKDISEMLDTK
jgi:Fe-S oxidoreductase/nitrate reductase gamma subunit